jgi:hypothetical protein
MRRLGRTTPAESSGETAQALRRPGHQRELPIQSLLCSLTECRDDTGKHEPTEGHHVDGSQPSIGGSRSLSGKSLRKRVVQAKERSATQGRGKSTKARWACGNFTRSRVQIPAPRPILAGDLHTEVCPTARLPRDASHSSVPDGVNFQRSVARTSVAARAPVAPNEQMLSRLRMRNAPRLQSTARSREH